MLKNAIWNLLGQLLPLLAALFCIPVLISHLGVERFGILSLIWIVIGYFSLFDFGIGKAVTKLVAERLGNEQAQDIPGIIASSLAALLGMGIVIMSLGLIFSSGIAHLITDTGAVSQPEIIQALRLLFLATPMVILSATLRGVAEAHKRFDLTNKIRIPTGILNFAAPTGCVLSGYDSLVIIVIMLALVRLGAFILFINAVRRLVPDFYRFKLVRLRIISPLVRFGGWISLSSIISPLMVYGDRFLIAGLLSATAVTYYATPYDLMTRLWFIPVALAGVLFPTFSEIRTTSSEDINALFTKSVKYIFALMFILTYLCIANAELGLTLWLGREFATQSTAILQIIAIGVMVNSVAQIPFSLIHAAGYPKITAVLHLTELPVYLLALVLLMPSFGIQGVALIWLARIVFDTLMLFIIARVKLGVRLRVLQPALLLPVLMLIHAPNLIVESIQIRLIYSILTTLLLTMVFWFWCVSRADKLTVASLIPSALKK